jgi:hypothetical protein
MLMLFVIIIINLFPMNYYHVVYFLEIIHKKGSKNKELLLYLTQ